MNAVNNEQEYLVQKIRTQYTEKQHTESGNRKKLCKKGAVKKVPQQGSQCLKALATKN